MTPAVRRESWRNAGKPPGSAVADRSQIRREEKKIYSGADRAGGE
jgi:hypothetical protein